MKKQLSILLLLAAAVCAVRAQAQVVVIANAGVKAADVGKSELRDVFTGASGSLAGSKVTPVLMKSGAATDAFLSEYVGKSDSAFLAGWRSLVFSGEAAMPKTLESDSAVVAYVAANPGAVGYISKAAPHDGVKVLSVH
jgi:ABC-type phosphate transport system substrate-binding protein